MFRTFSGFYNVDTHSVSLLRYLVSPKISVTEGGTYFFEHSEGLNCRSYHSFRTLEDGYCLVPWVCGIDWWLTSQPSHSTMLFRFAMPNKPKKHCNVERRLCFIGWKPMARCRIFKILWSVWELNCLRPCWFSCSSRSLAKFHFHLWNFLLWVLFTKVNKQKRVRMN